ncbi:MAG TPA: Uma2 family endonuclease [Lachnospiraceae bacterium]|nr:Uma2 family endonuclease [Lachnospiraceae bacterium]
MNPILTDMAGAYIEHSSVITNFVAAVHSQIRASTCRVYPDNVQYRWTADGKEKTVIPDATINCRVHAKRGNAFFDIPRFVMEVLSDSTRKFDRGEKMDIYRKMEIDEYWIVDWEKRQVEIYSLDYDENGDPQYHQFNVITEKNKDELRIVHFPNIKIMFDELFDVE